MNIESMYHKKIWRNYGYQKAYFNSPKYKIVCLVSFFYNYGTSKYTYCKYVYDGIKHNLFICIFGYFAKNYCIFGDPHS